MLVIREAYIRRAYIRDIYSITINKHITEKCAIINTSSCNFAGGISKNVQLLSEWPIQAG